jgi:hypothetical protein
MPQRVRKECLYFFWQTRFQQAGARCCVINGYRMVPGFDGIGKQQQSWWRLLVFCGMQKFSGILSSQNGIGNNDVKGATAQHVERSLIC